MPHMLAAGMITLHPDRSILIRTGNSSSVLGPLERGWENFGLDTRRNLDPEAFNARENKLEGVVEQGFTQVLKQSIPEPQVKLKRATINYQVPTIT